MQNDITSYSIWSMTIHCQQIPAFNLQKEILTDVFLRKSADLLRFRRNGPVGQSTEGRMGMVVLLDKATLPLSSSSDGSRIQGLPSTDPSSSGTSVHLGFSGGSVWLAVLSVVRFLRQGVPSACFCRFTIVKLKLLGAHLCLADFIPTSGDKFHDRTHQFRYEAAGIIIRAMIDPVFFAIRICGGTDAAVPAPDFIDWGVHAAHSLFGVCRSSTEPVHKTADVDSDPVRLLRSHRISAACNSGRRHAWMLS